MKPFCYVCREVRDDLLKLPVGGSAMFLDGIRRAIPSGLWVCPDHTPISCMEERPPGRELERDAMNRRQQVQSPHAEAERNSVREAAGV
jgi:hypothetical protein